MVKVSKEDVEKFELFVSEVRTVPYYNTDVYVDKVDDPEVVIFLKDADKFRVEGIEIRKRMAARWLDQYLEKNEDALSGIKIKFNSEH